MQAMRVQNSTSRVSARVAKSAGKELRHAPQQQEVCTGAGEVLDGAVHDEAAAPRRDEGRSLGLPCCWRIARAGAQSRGLWQILACLRALRAGCSCRVGRRSACLRRHMAIDRLGIRPLLRAQRRGRGRRRQVAPVGQVWRQPEFGAGRARRQQELWGACRLGDSCSARLKYFSNQCILLSVFKMGIIQSAATV